jgi:hypothetical protein
MSVANGLLMACEKLAITKFIQFVIANFSQAVNKPFATLMGMVGVVVRSTTFC